MKIISLTTNVRIENIKTCHKTARSPSVSTPNQISWSWYPSSWAWLSCSDTIAGSCELTDRCPGWVVPSRRCWCSSSSGTLPPVGTAGSLWRRFVFEVSPGMWQGFRYEVWGIGFTFDLRGFWAVRSTLSCAAWTVWTFYEGVLRYSIEVIYMRLDQCYY